MGQLVTGLKAPDFSLRDQNGNTVNLSDYKGRKVLLYFYPKADTPGCTRQSCSVRDARQELGKLTVDVLGISPDPPEKQREFDLKYSLGFPLLADTDHATADAYGVWGALGIERSSFLIDEEGRIIRAWYKVRAEDTVPKAMEMFAEASRPMVGY